MIKVIGVRFKKAGKIYYFDPLQYTVEKDSAVIVETARGIEFGQCCWHQGNQREGDFLSA